MMKVGCQSALVSIISIGKKNCVTREVYERQHRAGEFVSLGDVLEAYVERILNGEIYKETALILNGAIDKETSFKCESKNSDLFKLLKPSDERRLENNDPEYIATFRDIYPDVPVEMMQESKSKIKFSRSECKQDTLFIRT